MTTATPRHAHHPRCLACIDHPGWAHGDESRRREPGDTCRHCYGSGTAVGWCYAHSDVHPQRGTCVEFESDADFIARMLREDAEHDAHMAGHKEAAYVEEWRPY